MVADVRDIPHISAADVAALNFIQQSSRFVLRRHYRQGLRSHIMEILDPDEVANERKGVVSNGIKWYPRAKPIKMLRIFRTKFENLDDGYQEIRKVRLISDFLGNAYFANSIEFLVSYRLGCRWDILLCGLQEYVTGVAIDPWGHLNPARLAINLARPGIGQTGPSPEDIGKLENRIKQSATVFITRVKQMVNEGGHLPDLAGEGNLILTDGGHVKLVDINNISQVDHGSTIYLDDKGYPVCDKSIEALFLMERHLAGSDVDRSEQLYRVYLDPNRMRAVADMERRFQDAVRQPSSDSA